jgi:hypothetical protein
MQAAEVLEGCECTNRKHIAAVSTEWFNPHHVTTTTTVQPAATHFVAWIPEVFVCVGMTLCQHQY